MAYTFSSVSTLPYDFYDGCAVVANNKIYIMGGTGDADAFYCYDDTNGWVSLGNLPYDFVDGSAFVDAGGQIHILGSSVSGNERKYYIYNPSIPDPYDKWGSAGTLPYDFYGGYAGLDGDYVCILGGAGNDKSRAFRPLDQTSWNTSSNVLPHSFVHGSAVTTETGFRMICGDYCWDFRNFLIPSVINDEPLSDVGYPYYYSYGDAVIDSGGTLYLVGGTGNEFACYEGFYGGFPVYNQGNLPYSFFRGCTVLYNGKIHILGGEPFKQRHYAGTPIPNKVIYGNRTLIDLSSDNVTEADVLNGKIFHARNGAVLTGTATPSGGSSSTTLLVEGTAQDSPIGTTGIGTWQNTLNSPTKAQEEAWGWMEFPELHGIGSADDLKVTITYDPAKSDPITLGGYIIDDVNDMICIKFGNTISLADTATAVVGIEIATTEIYDE